MQYNFANTKFNSQKSSPKNSGFTLIELIVVLGIIGILSAALIFTVNPLTQFEKGRDTTRKADLNNIMSTFEIYRQAEGRYPPAPLTCGEELSAGGITYMTEIPCDPKGQSYSYSVDDQGVVYSIYACLEYENDPSIANEDDRSGLCETAYIRRNP